MFAVLIGFHGPNWAVFDAKALKEKTAKPPARCWSSFRSSGGRSSRADGSVDRPLEQGGPTARAASTRATYPQGSLFGHPIGYSFLELGPEAAFERYHNDELVGNKVGVFTSIPRPGFQGHRQKGKTT